MKKTALLVISGMAMLGIAACQKDPVVDPVSTSEDQLLAGETVTVGETSGGLRKLFILNEGQLGTNNATLDFLRFSDGKYVTNAYSQMNPSISGGVGDVGNDLAVQGDRLWMVVNNSGLVEVVNPVNEKHIASIAIPSPRRIAFDDRYAYVTSWAGAYAVYGADYSVSDYSNPKGLVYRIDLSTLRVDGTVEVGYQPEGLSVWGGKLYVANSGGLTLPPDYAYDKTLSIIDLQSFKVIKTVEVAPNLRDVYADGKGHLFVTSMGNFYDVHSGAYVLSVSDPDRAERAESILWGGYVTCSALFGSTLYCIGTETEFDWSADHAYTLWSLNLEDASEVRTGIYPLKVTASVPYGMAVTGSCLYLGDAGDYVNPGLVICYALDGTFEERWRVRAGVDPGHFAIW